MADSEPIIYDQVVRAGLEIDRIKAAYRQQENSAQRMTWLSSQITQTDDPRIERQREDEEVEAATRTLRASVVKIDSSACSNICRLKVSDPQYVVFLRAVAQACRKSGSGEIIVRVFSGTLDQVIKERITRQSDLLQELALNVGNLPEDSMAFIALQILDLAIPLLKSGFIDEYQKTILGSLFEILSKLLSSVGSAKKGFLDPRGRCVDDIMDLDGSAFINVVALRLCRSHWNADTIFTAANGLKDICMSQASVLDAQTIEALEQKLTRLLEETPPVDIAKVAIAIMDMSRTFPSRRSCIKNIIEFFETRETRKNVLPCFGAFLNRLYTSVSVDAKLGSETIKVIEAIPNWSPTCLGFLLAIQRTVRFEVQCIDLIRRRALDLALAMTMLEKIGVVRSSQLTEEGDDGSETANSDFHILKHSLFTLCENGKVGNWDLIVPAVLKLGIRLADEEYVFPPSGHPHFDVVQGQKTRMGLVASLGLDILVRCYRLFALIRFDLNALMIDRALVAESGAGALPMVRLLNMLAQDPACSRAMFIDHGAWVKDLLALLPNVSPRVGHGFIKGLSCCLAPSSPHRELRDHAMLVFRKALFQRSLSSRLIAMFGVLACCRMPQAGSACVIGDLTDQLDAIGCLRRVLSQQTELRLALYHALSHYPLKFREDLLLSHLSSGYLELNDDIDLPPFFIDRCVDQSTGRCIEPLSHLIAALTSSCGAGDRQASDGWISKSHVTRFCNVSLQTFDLDKNSILTMTTSEGVKHRAMFGIIMGTCEVLIDAMLRRIPDNADNFLDTEEMRNAAALFRIWKGFKNLLDEADKREGFEAASLKSKRIEGEIENESQASASTKKKKKVTAASGEENDDDAKVESKDKAKELKLLKDSIAPPEKGEFLSDHSLQLLLKALLKAHSPGGISPTESSSTASDRFNTAKLVVQPLFQEYVLSAVHNRIRSLGIATTNSSIPPSTIAGLHESSISKTKQLAEMAESCAGFCPPPPEQVCSLFVRPLASILKRCLVEIETYSQAETSSENGIAQRHKRSKLEESEKARADEVAKERKNAETLYYLTLECLHDSFLVASRSSRTALMRVLNCTGRHFRTEDQTENDDEDTILNQAISVALSFVEVSIANNNVKSTLPAIGLTRCLLAHVAPKSLAWLRSHCASIERIIRERKVASVPVVKEMVEMLLDLSTRIAPRGDLGPAFERMCTASIEALTHSGLTRSKPKRAKKGEDGETGQEDGASGSSPASNELKIKMISSSPSAVAAVQTVVACLYRFAIEECERLVAVDASVVTKSANQRTLIAYFMSISHVLKLLLEGSNVMHRDGTIEIFLKGMVRTLKCLSKFLKKVTAIKAVFAPEALESLVSFISKGVLGPFDACITVLETKKQNKSKQNKVIPEAVFAVEQYELTLLKASKACKEVSDLKRFVKRTTARDFRLDSEKIKQELQGCGEEEEEDDV